MRLWMVASIGADNVLEQGSSAMIGWVDQGQLISPESWASTATAVRLAIDQSRKRHERILVGIGAFE